MISRYKTRNSPHLGAIGVLSAPILAAAEAIMRLATHDEHGRAGNVAAAAVLRFVPLPSWTGNFIGRVIGASFWPGGAL